MRVRYVINFVRLIAGRPGGCMAHCCYDSTDSICCGYTLRNRSTTNRTNGVRASISDVHRRALVTPCHRTEAEYCDELVCLSVCLSVRLYASISQESHIQTLPNFLRLLPMAASQSSSLRRRCDNVIYFRFRGRIVMFSHNGPVAEVTQQGASSQ